LDLGEGGAVALNFLSDADTILKLIRGPTLQKQLTVIKKTLFQDVM